MTLEQLRKEASKLGYTLTKKIIYEKVRLCPICKKRPVPELSINPRGKYYRCPRCGIRGEVHKTSYMAISNWNREVEKYER